MEYQVRDNSGVLFKNDQKTQDNFPDYKGSIVINGVEYWLSSWIKTSQKGTKFMSLAVKPKEAQKPKTMPAKPVQQAQDEFDDPIPF